MIELGVNPCDSDEFRLVDEALTDMIPVPGLVL